MSAAIKAESDRNVPKLFGGVYRVESELARGGMARIFRVVDQRDGKTYALKQLYTDESGASLRAMFEREYHTLVQLAHPRIVRVFDFGVEGDLPFYVMELLEGMDARHALREQKPSIREICTWLRDCASALALIHSRRMVHRDVSPRNLWCTPDGRAKLIDFGTLVAMGPQTRIAGTPPFVPPEALNALPLDGRCDVYALGALAYTLLTERAAFPARTLADLPLLWQRRPEPPDAIRADVPKALSDLVMAMLSFDPRGRPATASEVVQRLTRIADLPQENEQALAQAFLSSPNLVGRKDALAQLRKRVRRGMGRRGSTLALVADGGLGRSRLLANTVLEAKLAGAIAITASATAVGSGALSVATALAERLLEAQPLAGASILDQAGILSQLSPTLHRLLGEPKPVELTSLERLRKLSAALEALFRTVSRDNPLVLGVDDVHRADSASLAVLAKLSMLTHEQRLLLMLTCDASVLGNAPPALEQLVSSRHSIQLTPLAPEHTRELMASLFGEVCGLDEAAAWLHEVSQGSPGSCMQYAQYLVDQGLARYDDGHWRLPEHLQGQGLPESLGGMFEKRVQALPEDARVLALGLALGRDESRAVWQPESHISIEDFPALLDTQDSGRVYAALDALLQAGVLQQRDEYYVVAQRALVDALVRLSAPALQQQLHERVAAIFAPRAGHARWIATRQFILAAEYRQARELLIATMRELAANPADFGAMRVSLSSDCGRVLHEDWRKTGGSPLEGIVIRRLLLMVCAVYDWSLAEFGDEQLAQLRHDCGLAYWEQTDPAQPDLQRLLECIKRASERYEATVEAERGLAPLDALREIASAALGLSGAAVASHDCARSRAIGPLFQPLRALTPLLDLIGELCGMCHERLTGRDLGYRLYTIGAERMLGATELPDVLRMGAAGVNVHIQSVEDARRGRLRGLELLELLTPFVGEDMFLVVHGRWLSHAFHGNGSEARRLYRQVQLITEDDVWRRRSFYFAEVELHALTGDQGQLRSTCDAIEALAHEFPGWQPWLHYGRAALQTARGEFAAARAQLDAGLQLAAAGEHRAWTRLAPARAELSLLMGDLTGAIQAADAMLSDVVRLDLDHVTKVSAERIAALAFAALGDHDAAGARLGRAQQAAAQLALDGLPLALLREAEARVALARGALDSATEALASMWQLLQNADAPALFNAYEALRAQCRHGQALPAALSGGVIGRTTITESTLYTQIHTLLTQLETPHERINQALTLLLEDSGASGGHLLLFGKRGLFAAAAMNENRAGDSLLQAAQALVGQNLEIRTVTVTASDLNQELSARLHDGDTPLAPVMLVDRMANPPSLVGVALLAQHGAPLRAPREELVRIVSRCLHEGGDSIAVALDD